REKPAWDSHHLSQQLLEEDALYTLHSAIPSILWHVDPHVAASQLAHHTTAALQQVARPRKTWKRKSHISDNTWMLIESKKFHFKHLRQLTRTWRYTILQVCFHSWRTSTAPGTSNTSTLCQELRCGLPQWLQLHDKAVAQTTRQYRQATQQAKQAIQEEDTAYYQLLRELCTGRGWLFEMRDDLEWLGAFRQLPFELPHALLQNYEEGVHDYAWWQPDPATPLVITCFAQLAACLQQWMLNPTEEAFHNDFFNLLFNFDIPEFQAARIFIAWIETEFQDLHSACDPELYDLLERSHLSMLEDIHIWQLRARRKHLMQCWDRLEQGEPKPARASKKQPMPHQRSHPVLSTYRAMPSVEADRRHWVILHPPKIIKTLGAGPYYVVHLYSGRRRDDDFHHFMQQFLEEGPQQISQSVLVISIDTAIDATMNVHDAKLWAFLLEAARNGQILALLLGPPCETWSGARFEEQVDEEGKPIKGPRPLRGAPDLPWGLEQLSLKELFQILIGNGLLLKGLHLSACVACQGGAVALEHPAPPLQIERPSIWRTAIVKLLCSAGMPFRQYTFQQWKHGAKGVKPTTLLYAHAAIPRVFAANEQPQFVRPTAPLIGRAADGSFKTAVAKEYPAGMNFCFAEAFWLHISARFARHQAPTTIPGASKYVQELAKISACVDRDRSIMPDYQPLH
ncbi:unnamed protein product, partial [Cladocopium goreaui]